MSKKKTVIKDPTDYGTFYLFPDRMITLDFATLFGGRASEKDLENFYSSRKFDGMSDDEAGEATMRWEESKNNININGLLVSKPTLVSEFVDAAILIIDKIRNMNNIQKSGAHLGIYIPHIDMQLADYIVRTYRSELMNYLSAIVLCAESDKERDNILIDQLDKISDWLDTVDDPYTDREVVLEYISDDFKNIPKSRIAQTIDNVGELVQQKAESSILNLLNHLNFQDIISVGYASTMPEWTAKTAILNACKNFACNDAGKPYNYPEWTIVYNVREKHSTASAGDLAMKYLGPTIVFPDNIPNPDYGQVSKYRYLPVYLPNGVKISFLEDACSNIFINMLPKSIHKMETDGKDPCFSLTDDMKVVLSSGLTKYISNAFDDSVKKLMKKLSKGDMAISYPIAELSNHLMVASVGFTFTHAIISNMIDRFREKYPDRYDTVVNEHINLYAKIDKEISDYLRYIIDDVNKDSDIRFAYTPGIKQIRYRPETTLEEFGEQLSLIENRISEGLREIISYKVPDPTEMCVLEMCTTLGLLKKAGIQITTIEYADDD